MYSVLLYNVLLRYLHLPPLVGLSNTEGFSLVRVSSSKSVQMCMLVLGSVVVVEVKHTGHGAKQIFPLFFNVVSYVFAEYL